MNVAVAPGLMVTVLLEACVIMEDDAGLVCHEFSVALPVNVMFPVPMLRALSITSEPALIITGPERFISAAL